MKWHKFLLIVFLLAYLIMWGGGLSSHIFMDGPPVDMPWTAPLFLFLAGGIVIIAAGKDQRFPLLLVGMLGFSAEVIGVHSGMIFGSYEYTDALSPQVFDVPLVMVPAWLVLVAYVWQMLAQLVYARWKRVILAGIWMTVIDLVLDPLAAGDLGYWTWTGSGTYYGIPDHNFLGWFLISVLVSSILPRTWATNFWGVHTGLSIIVFFTTLAWLYGLVVAGIVGLGLLVLHIGLHHTSCVKR